MKMQIVIVLGVLLVVLHINVGGATPLQLPEVLRHQPTWDTCVHIPTGGLRCVSWNTRGLLGSTAYLSNLQGTEAKLPLAAGWRKDIICLQENAWKRRVRTSSSSTAYPVSNVLCFRFRQRERWRIGYFFIRTFCLTMRLSLT